MKKLVFMFVAVAAISFASCGNKTAQAEAVDSSCGNKTAQAEAVDSDSIAVVDSADTVAAAADTVAADTVAADSVK